MERRQSSRIPFKAPAYVLPDSRAAISNISRHGIFVETHCHHAKGDTTQVTLWLHRGENTVTVVLPCTVARVSDTGIGCISAHLEPEALLFFSNLIHSARVPAPEFMSAFYRYLGGFDQSHS
jgi:hypothetical protein